MGGAGSKERSAGVGVGCVLLSGRIGSGKGRLLAALGKKAGTWEAGRGGSRLDRETHTYGGVEITKVSTNSAGVEYVIRAATDMQRLAGGETAGNDVCVWFLIDEERRGDLAEAGRELAMVARGMAPLGIPVWVLVNVSDARILKRRHCVGFGIEGVAELTHMRPDDVMSIRGTVKRVLRVYARRSSRDPSPKESDAPDLGQLQQAMRGKHDWDV